MIPATTTIRLIDIKDDDIIKNVFNNYVIYDNNYRNTLNNKIINHYLYDEIGFETPFMFAHYLKVKLDEIMPKYNKLYSSSLLSLDPLSNFSYQESLEREIEATSENKTNSETSSNSSNTGSSSSNSTNTINSSGTETENHVFQQTPQGALAQQSIQNYTYATTHNMDGIDKSSTSTNALRDSTENESENSSTGSNTTTGSNTNNSTENYIKRIAGSKNITTTEMLTDFINNFKSIDLMIIEELETLFLQKIDLI